MNSIIFKCFHKDILIVDNPNFERNVLKLLTRVQNGIVVKIPCKPVYYNS